VSSPTSPQSPILSSGQVELLASRGEERTAAEGEFLFRIGDAHYPLIVVLEGEAAILDGAGNEIARQGPGGFLGELNLMTGQTVYVDGVVTQPMRYIAVDREEVRSLLSEDGALADLLLHTFMRRREILQEQEGVGLEVIGPRSSAETRRLVDYARRGRLPHVWRDTEGGSDPEAAKLVTDFEQEELPLVRLPGGKELRNPSSGQLARTLGIGLELRPREEIDLAVIGGGPAGLAAAVYGASEGLDTLVVEGSALGGQAGISRRIENYLGFPGGISGVELARSAMLQAVKFGTRLVTPRAVTGLAPEPGRGFRVRLDDELDVIASAVVVASGVRYRRLGLPGLAELEGRGVYYAAGQLEAPLVSGRNAVVVGGANSAGQAALFLARQAGHVHVLIRRDHLRDTMSHYLAQRLTHHERITVHPRSELSAVRGTNRLAAVTWRDQAHERDVHLDAAAVFLLIGAEPCTTALVEAGVELDDHGFVITGEGYSTSLPGVFAVGDVRAGSVKRVASAVGEGSVVISAVHAHLANLETPGTERKANP
jgi:thioredoxin reductase (NADPH)